MIMRLTVLIDTYIGLPIALVKSLRTEYGFSILIEKNDKKVLMDVGLSGDALLHNMKNLGIAPDDIDLLVLSHRHSDHTGGLRKFLEARNRRTMIVSHPGVFEPSIVRVGGALHEIGLGLGPEELKRLNAVHVPSRAPLEIVEGIWFSGEIPRKWGPTHSGLVYRVDPEKGLVPDDMKDDTALYIKTPKGLLVVTGCGHAGVENIVEYGLQVTGEEKLYGVVGGLHLLGASEEREREVVEYLASKEPELVAATHCTGQRAQYLLYKKLGKAYRLTGVGDVIEVGQ